MIAGPIGDFGFEMQDSSNFKISNERLLHDRESEIKLRAEFEEAPAHNFVWGQPLRAVPGVLRQDSAPVEHVVNVEIAFERETFDPKTL